MAETITAEELKEEMDHGWARVINVLSKENYDQMRIRGSESFPLDELEKEKWEELDGDVVVYCASYSCSASEKAATFLEEKGIEVKDYEGGMLEWAEKGYPVAGELSRKEYLEESE